MAEWCLFTFGRYVRNPNYAFKSLRLLARRSNHFFGIQSMNHLHKKQHEFLEIMIGKLAKEKAPTAVSIFFFKNVNCEFVHASIETTDNNYLF